MISVKELHMQQTVEAALAYLKGRGSEGELSKRFNQLCKDWHADAYNPDDLSLDVDDIAMALEDEPWVCNIAAMPDSERTWQMNVRVVEEFIVKYFAMKKEEVTSKNVADVLLVADPLSRRHILAQRVVIECINDVQTKADLRFLDCIMGKLATNPLLEK